MYFHVELWPRSAEQREMGELYAFDLSEEVLRAKFVDAYEQARSITWNGRTVPGGDVATMKVGSTEEPFGQHPGSNPFGISPDYEQFKQAPDVTNEWISGAPGEGRLSPTAASTVASVSPTGSTSGTEKPHVFLGSSAEGLETVKALQIELQKTGKCTVMRWDQGAFKPGDFSLEALLHQASEADFAILVATPDDISVIRGDTKAVARDNVLLELGIFLGALGKDRTYMLTVGNVNVPSDLDGLTRLTCKEPQGKSSWASELTAAVTAVEGQLDSLGSLHRVGGAKADSRPSTNANDASSLADEIELLVGNATAQGWTIKTNSSTTIRLVSPGGRTFTMSKGRAEATRRDLRDFVAKLRANGLRVNDAIRRDPEESPY